MDVTLVALEGTTIDPGRLLAKPETGREAGVGIYSAGCALAGGF